MPKKYHINAELAGSRRAPVFKLSTIEKDRCLGCLECAKRDCIYDVYAKRRFLPEQLMDNSGESCRLCMRCVQECHNQILVKTLNPEYVELGNDYWTPAIITSLWEQATTGKIPVSGAGYDGPFAAPGFDDMWTDMSEIVRPTRDGIHGREYISTAIDVGAKPNRLRFVDGDLRMKLPPLFTIPSPLALRVPERAKNWPVVEQAIVHATEETGTICLCENPKAHPGHHTAPSYGLDDPIITDQRRNLIEIRLESSRKHVLEKALKKATEAAMRMPDVVIAIGMPLDGGADDAVLRLAEEGFGAVCLYAADDGQCVDRADDVFIKDAIRQIHLVLVDKGLRDQITIFAGGGVAMIEHGAKLIACGADAVIVDLALLVALECRLCGECLETDRCETGVDQINAAWGARRIVNLLCSWHAQLIEVLGAMGLREARRLRGETGRVMFFEDLEEECFAPIFGKRIANGP